MEHISKHLNPVPAKQESTPPVTGEEVELGLCLAEPKIKNANLEQLKEALRYSMVLVGLRAQNWPNEQEKALLLAYIVENYGGHTVSEIKLAFKMAVAGRLDVEEVSCYENFSVLYFSTIMNAYRKWAREAVAHLPKNQVQLPAPRISDEEFIQSVKYLYEMNKDFRQIPAIAYKTLGLATKLSKEEKEAVKLAVKQLIDDPTDDNYKQFACKLYFDNN